MEALDEREAVAARNDKRLIASLQLGDVDAFEIFYKDYRPRLRSFIFGIVRNEEMIDEVFNDVMMVVWSKISDFEGRSRLSTWVFSIAYRRALKERNKPGHMDYADQAMPEGALEAEAEHALEAEKTKDRIRAALGKLPADQGTVVRLAYFEGLTYRDIGAIMDCPQDTVKTRMFHARRKLKAALGGTLSDWL